MKRLVTFVVSGVLLMTMPGFAGSNPFQENTVKIETSASSYAFTGEEAVHLQATAVAKKDVDQAIAKLEEANRNFSALLKKFAQDPNKFADKNGDYRGFIKQLELLSKRLSEVAEKLKKTSAGLEAKAGKKADTASKTIRGTVKVGSSLNVRSGPWGQIIGSLHNNDQVKIIGKSGDWYKIDHGGKTAYVHANYIETAEKSAGKTAVKPSDSGNASSLVEKSSSSARGGGLTASPCQPMPSRASSEYGWRTHPTLRTRRFHSGIDLPIGNGTRLNSLGNGTVVGVGYESGGGKYVKVKYDNGYESFYCHLKNYSVRKGQRVSAGQEIARSDNTGQWTTGAHLHFGLKKNGKSVNPRSAGIPLP